MVGISSVGIEVILEDSLRSRGRDGDDVLKRSRSGKRRTLESRGKESIKSRSGGILWCIFPKVGLFLVLSTHRIIGKGWIAFVFAFAFIACWHWGLLLHIASSIKHQAS